MFRKILNPIIGFLSVLLVLGAALVSAQAVQTADFQLDVTSTEGTGNPILTFTERFEGENPPGLNACWFEGSDTNCTFFLSNEVPWEATGNAGEWAYALPSNFFFVGLDAVSSYAFSPDAGQQGWRFNMEGADVTGFYWDSSLVVTPTATSTPTNTPGPTATPSPIVTATPSPEGHAFTVVSNDNGWEIQYTGDQAEIPNVLNSCWKLEEAPFYECSSVEIAWESTSYLVPRETYFVGFGLEWAGLPISYIPAEPFNGWDVTESGDGFFFEGFEVFLPFALR